MYPTDTPWNPRVVLFAIRRFHAHMDFCEPLARSTMCARQEYSMHLCATDRLWRFRRSSCIGFLSEIPLMQRLVQS